MLRWMGDTLQDTTGNECVHNKFMIALIEDMMTDITRDTLDLYNG